MHTGESGRVNMSSFSSKCYYCRDNDFGPVEGYIQFYDNSENPGADSDSSNSEGGSSDSKTSLIPTSIYLYRHVIQIYRWILMVAR